MEDQTAPPWKLNTATIIENHKLGYTEVNWLTCLRHKAPALYDEDIFVKRCSEACGIFTLRPTLSTSCLPVVKKFSRPWHTCSSILRALVRKVPWPWKPVMKRSYPQQWTGAVEFSWLSDAAPTRVDCYVTRLASSTFIVVLKAENCEHIKTNRSKQTFEESPLTCDLMV